MNEETKKEMLIAIKNYRKSRLIGFGSIVALCLVFFIMDLINPPNGSKNNIVITNIFVFVISTIKFISVIIITNNSIKKIENSEISQENEFSKVITTGIKLHNKYMGGFKIKRVLFLTFLSLIIIGILIYISFI